jgi:hypothetical protein
MIVFDLTCAIGHRFESWFQSGAAYDAQRAEGTVACPYCGDREIGKAPMAPRIARGTTASAAGEGDGGSSGSVAPPAAGVSAGAPAPLFEMLRRIRRHIEHNCEYVGPTFPEQARRIYYGESAPRDIYGEASADEAAALEEEGIEAQRIPWLPRHDG